MAPMSMEKMTARGMSRWGFLLSPPSCSACSKPTRANTAPPSETARSTPWSPKGAKPWPVKLAVLKWVKKRTKMVITGTMTFQVVMAPSRRSSTGPVPGR